MKSDVADKLVESIATTRRDLQIEIKHLKAAVSELQQLIKLKEDKLKRIDVKVEFEPASVISDGCTESISVKGTVLNRITDQADKNRVGLKCLDKYDKEIYVDDVVELSPKKTGKFAGITVGTVVGLYKGRKDEVSIRVQLKKPVFGRDGIDYIYITDHTWRASTNVIIKKNDGSRINKHNSTF